VRGLFDLWDLVSRWLHATSAVLQLAPQAQMTPPRAAYYAACMISAERAYHVRWQRLAAIIQHESQWRPALVSATNDYGLGQHHCPSFFCRRHPSGLTRSVLLEPCSNIQLTAQELAHKRARCRHHAGCRDYVRLYNPGNPTYAAQIHRWERRFDRAAQGPRAAPLALE
jgi:hypothetical protein